MIPATAGSDTLTVELSDIRSIKPVEGNGHVILGLGAARFVVALAADVARAIDPHRVEGPQKAPGRARSPKSTKATGEAKNVAPGGFLGPRAQFYKACRAAGYELCATCHAYRQIGHADCSSDYLYRVVVVGAYSKPPAIVQLVGDLESEGDPESMASAAEIRKTWGMDTRWDETIPEPVCEAVA